MPADENAHLSEALEAQSLDDSQTLDDGLLERVEVQAQLELSPKKEIDIRDVAANKYEVDVDQSSDELENEFEIQSVSEISPLDLELEKKFEEEKRQILEKISNDPYMTHPLLRDERTIEWVGRNYVMIIMRGLAGSGKSTLVIILLILSCAVIIRCPDTFQYQFSVQLD